MNSLQVHRLFSTNHSHCWLALALSYTLSSWVLSLNSKHVVQGCSPVQLKSGARGQQGRVTQVLRVKPAVSREEGCGKRHVNFTTHVMEQNAFMQKRLSNTFSVPDTRLGAGEITADKKRVIQEAYIPLRGKTINRHSINT